VGIAGYALVIYALFALAVHSLGAEEINEGWPMLGKMEISIM
jgi:hypothetical protein